MDVWQYRQKVSKSIAILLVSRYQKVSRNARYQYREILVSRYIEVSSVSPSTNAFSDELHKSLSLPPPLKSVAALKPCEIWLFNRSALHWTLQHVIQCKLINAKLLIYSCDSLAVLWHEIQNNLIFVSEIIYFAAHVDNGALLNVSSLLLFLFPIIPSVLLSDHVPGNGGSAIEWRWGLSSRLVLRTARRTFAPGATDLRAATALSSPSPQRALGTQNSTVAIASHFKSFGLNLHVRQVLFQSP